MRQTAPIEDCVSRQRRLYVPPTLASAPAAASLAHWKKLAEGKALHDCGMPQPARRLLASITDDTAGYVDAQLRLTAIRWESGLLLPTEEEVERLDALIEATQRRDLRPALLALRSELFRRLGADSEFQAAIRSFRREFPTHPLSYSMRAQLKPAENLQELKAELQALRAEGRITEALALLQQNLKSTAALPKEYAELAMLEVELLTLSGNSRGAALQLEALAQSKNIEVAGKAKIAQALRLWNDNQSAEALAVLKRLPAQSSSRAQADYLQGRILEESHSLKAAAAAYRRIAPGNEWYAKALRQLAWIAIRRKEHAQAKELLRSLAAATQAARGSSASEAYYWNATLYDTAASRAELEAAYPLDDYSILLAVSPLLALARTETSEHCFAAPPEVLARRLQYLTAADLERFARHEVHYFIFRKAGTETSIADEALRAHLLASVGAHTSALRAAHAAMRRFTASALESAACSRTLLEQLYPRPFLQDYQTETLRSGVPLSLLYAVSRTESHFDPQAVSNRGAIGLMQLLPSTAEKEGLQPQEQLSDAAVNIRLGARHLRRLAREFSDEAFQIAAYNAGASAVRRWQRRYPELRGLMWAEHLGYEETKNYVRKVLAAKKVYQQLLQSQPQISSKDATQSAADAH